MSSLEFKYLHTDDGNCRVNFAVRREGSEQWAYFCLQEERKGQVECYWSTGPDWWEPDVPIPTFPIKHSASIPVPQGQTETDKAVREFLEGLRHE